MKTHTVKKSLLALAALGTLAFAGAANADMKGMKDMGSMEKCSIIDADGNTMLLLGDCKTATSSCAGKASNPDDWIMLPKGACAKIKGGKAHK